MHHTISEVHDGQPRRSFWTVGDLERLGAATTAGLLVAYGVSRRSVPGVVLAAAALPLAYRGVAGHWPGYLTLDVPRAITARALSGNRGIHVRESVRVERPLPEVYRFWRRLENLPRFMDALDSVTDLGNGRSRWVAAGPGGVRVAWDAEIINEVEDAVIGWRSLPESDIVTAGSVTFAAARGGRSTQVTVHLQYAPPAGRVGAMVAKLFGREPSQTVREDLRRLRQILEAGEIPRAAGEPVLGGGRS